MSLFDPPFEFRYRCLRCRVRHDEIRDDLVYVPKPCPRCGKRMEETRHLHLGVSTDSTFTKGWSNNDGFGDDDQSRKKARAIARANGVNPEGKRYFPNLAKKQFDPEAWVSDKHDVKKRCELNGWGCEGSVNVNPVVLDEPNVLEQPYEVDPKLVEREIKTKELASGQRMTNQERAAMKDKLMTAYSGEQD